MPWDRGAWEKTTSGGSNNNPKYTPPIYNDKPRKITNKRKEFFKKNIAKFISIGWNISKKKKNQYLNNNYYNAPYRLQNYAAISEKISNLISNKSNKNKILVISNNRLLLDEIQLEYSIKDHYKIYNSSNSITQIDNLVKNINEFEKINNLLFNKYAIKIFSDFQSLNNIQDLKILSQNLYYIDNNTAKLLNEFLKDYWKYYEMSNFSDIDLILAGRDVRSEVNNLSTTLISIKSYVKRLTKILDLLDFNIDYLDEFDIDLLQSNPSLININDLTNFLNCLENYQRLNFSKNLASDYFMAFSSNKFILGIIANFKRYVESEDKYNIINNEITNLKETFNSFGLYVNNLKEYNEIKDKIIKYENVLFIDDEDYFKLNEKLKVFLKHNLSFNDYFKKCQENVVFNLDTNSIYLNVNNAINTILKIFETLGVKIKSLSDLDNHQNDFNILLNYTKFNKKSTVANEETIAEYANNLNDSLKEICDTLIKNSVEVNEFELDRIIHNISIINRLIIKMGLKISSLNELKESFFIIANLENDISDTIFSSSTENYIENNISEIYNDLDALKNSIEYLFDKLKEKPDFKEYSMDRLSKSFNNYFKLGFIKSNLVSSISSINSFEDILKNYEIIIQNANDLMEINQNYEFKDKLESLLEELNYISQMHESKNYTTNQLILDNISDYKNSINNKYTKLIQSGFVSKDKLNDCDIESTIVELNNNIDIIRDYITVNGLYEENFKDIIKNNENIILNNYELKKKIIDANIYNFGELCDHLNKHNTDYELVREILDLSLEINLKEYEEFDKFKIEDIMELSNYIDNCIEFSGYVNKGLISKDFKFSHEKLKNLNLKVNSVENKLIDLKMSNSILENFSQINTSDVNEIKEKLNQIDNLVKFKSSDVGELIKNYKISVDRLLNLCNDYYIEFEINDTQFNTGDFIFNLEDIKKDIDIYSSLYNLENEIESYGEIINSNLSNIWEGALTDTEVIKDKLKLDEEFTRLYTQGIYTKKSLNYLSEISQGDLLFLDELKNMENQDLKSKYLLVYKNQELIIPEINKLNNVKKDDLNSYLKIFINLNKIFKSNEISECITLLEYNIKHNDSLKLINEYENNLKSHSITYYKFFDRRKFDMPIEEIMLKIENHFKFTSLIDNEIINERYLDSIKSNFNDFLEQVEILDNLKNEIIKDFTTCKLDNTSFDEIKKHLTDLNNSNLVLMDLPSFRNSFNKDYIEYFDYVYIVDDNDITGEDKLHMFLISKNKISDLKLMED